MGFARRPVASGDGSTGKRMHSEWRPAVAGRTSPVPMPPPRLADVQAVLFELGDVLYDATLWRRWFASLLARIGFRTNYREFFAPWDERFVREMHCGRQSFAEAFRGFLAATGLTHGQIDEIVVACASKRRDLEENLCPYPGVRSVLHQLAGRGLRLGVLTDSEYPARQLEERLERMHVLECFETVTSSRDMGRAKPDAACYRAAAEALGVAPSAVAFVGVRERDLAGAASAGCQAVSAPGGARLPGALCVHRFEEIGRVLGAEEPLSLAG